MILIIWIARPIRSHNDEQDVWNLFLPDAQYKDCLTHGSKIKVHVYSAIGAMDCPPAYIRRVVQDESNWSFIGQYWEPPVSYNWKHTAPKRNSGLQIYEAHVGMAQEAEEVGTFAEFTLNVLPRIANQGYNTVQLMAVMEHPYYGSFGCHVSNFFAVSSRFGML